MATGDGGKFEINELIEQQRVDYVRGMTRNCRSITGYM